MSMKHLHEYRDAEIAKKLINAIHSLKPRPMRFMEVCGTHTMSIFRHGIPALLPPWIELLSGPGCPVCVTALKDIDTFVSLSREKDVISATFGDLMRVPGSESSLGAQKAEGRDVRVVYSVFDALVTARENPDRAVVFNAVGFETTAPTIASALLTAEEEGISNFSIHSAHKMTPPALAALLDSPLVNIDGFLLPGHVSVITGTDGYRAVFDRYRVPSVIAGFEPVDILRAIYMLALQNLSGEPKLENAYERAVSPRGNPKAREIMTRIFAPADAMWRGIGTIPASGMVLKQEYDRFDACKRYGIRVEETPEPSGCACGDILMGIKKPVQCPMFGKGCTPVHPAGPCMVSGEGACAAYYRYMGDGESKKL
ncbi:MAG: hydrogenase formation protein HypD [Desulfamplus sp.]|nr:hydrogenase formation protein HypD [Desulfamplus sp.]